MVRTPPRNKHPFLLCDALGGIDGPDNAKQAWDVHRHHERMWQLRLTRAAVRGSRPSEVASSISCRLES